VGALRVAAYQLLFLDRVPPYAAVDDAVEAARASGGPKVAGFANAVLRKLQPGAEPPLPTDRRARAEVEHSLPKWMVEELALACPDDSLMLERAAAFAQPAPLVARANRLRTSRAAVMELLHVSGATTRELDVGGLTPEAFAVEGLGDPSRSPSFAKGLWT